jgi:hypothetical protein
MVEFKVVKSQYSVIYHTFVQNVTQAVMLNTEAYLFVCGEKWFRISEIKLASILIGRYKLLCSYTNKF